MKLDMKEQRDIFVTNLFNELSEEIGYDDENGSESFKKQIDELDFNGKNTEDYRFDKLTVLSCQVWSTETELGKISTMQSYGVALLYGWLKALEVIRNRQEDDSLYLCKVCDRLGYGSDTDLMKVDIQKNQAKIENLRPIFEKIGSIDTFLKELEVKE